MTKHDLRDALDAARALHRIRAVEDDAHPTPESGRRLIVARGELEDAERAALPEQRSQ